MRRKGGRGSALKKGQNSVSRTIGVYLSFFHSFCEARELPQIIQTVIEEKVASGGKGQVMVTIFLTNDRANFKCL